MGKKCLKCGYERKPQELAPVTECPDCGAIYAKVEAAIETQEAAQKQEKQKLIDKQKMELEKERRSAAKSKPDSNLIVCNDCRESVSKNAEACPHCGSPIRKQKKKRFGVGKIVLSIFGFLILVSLFSTGDNTSKVASSSPVNVSIVTNSEWDGSVRQVEKYLKKNLKDPDSYESIEWSRVAKVGEGYMVRAKYRAKNSFGGFVVENKIFILDSDGNVLSSSDYGSIRIRRSENHCPHPNPAQNTAADTTTINNTPVPG